MMRWTVPEPTPSSRAILSMPITVGGHDLPSATLGHRGQLAHLVLDGLLVGRYPNVKCRALRCHCCPLFAGRQPGSARRYFKHLAWPVCEGFSAWARSATVARPRAQQIGLCARLPHSIEGFHGPERALQLLARIGPHPSDNASRVMPGLWLQTTRWSWLAGFALACSSVAASAQARLASGCIPRGKIGRLWGAHCAGQDSRSVDAGLVVGAIGMWIRQRLWRSNRLRLPSQMSIGGPGTAH